LPQLWVDGAWAGLALAVGCAGLLNLLLVSSFIWTELLAGRLVWGLWLLLATVWLGAAAFSALFQPPAAPAVVAGIERDLFREAQSEYLRGNWFEAETLLARLLEQQPRDVEARLMLATLLRHNRRTSEAQQQLLRLECLEPAEVWRVEIANERVRLAELQRIREEAAISSGSPQNVDAEATNEQAPAEDVPTPTGEDGQAMPQAA
jgi:hypothetical protein